jgi:hypothetical protein
MLIPLLMLSLSASRESEVEAGVVRAVEATPGRREKIVHVFFDITTETREEGNGSDQRRSAL